MEHYFQKITLLFLALLLVFSTYLLVEANPNELVLDGTIHYFQAKSIISGNTDWFDTTQLPGYAFFLAPFFALSNGSLVLMRELNAILLALSGVLLFLLISRHFSPKIALLSVFIWVVCAETFRYASQLYAEPLFVFLVLFSIWWYQEYLRILAPRGWPYWVAWSFMLGWMGLTHPAGVLVLLLFLADLIRRKQYSFLPVPLVGLLALAAYTLTNQWVVSFEKRFELSFAGDLYWGFLTYGLAFSLLALTSFLSENRKAFGAKALIILYAFFLVLFFPAIFFRHVWIILPLLSLLIAILFFEQRQAVVRGIIIALLIIHFIMAVGQVVGVLPAVSPGEGVNRYFVTVPEGCQSVESFYDACRQSMVELPQFNQAANTVCAYSARIQTGTVDDIRVLYTSSQLNIKVDEPLPLSPGWHDVEVKVTNRTQKGGLGQFLLCQKQP